MNSTSKTGFEIITATSPDIENLNLLLAPVAHKLTDQSVSYLLALLEQSTFHVSKPEFLAAPYTDARRIVCTVSVELKEFAAAVKALNIQLNSITHDSPLSI